MTDNKSFNDIRVVISDLIENLYKFIPILIIASLTIFGIYRLSLTPRKPLSLSPTISTDFAYDSKSFLPAIASVKKIDNQTPNKIIVIPHHLTASPLIAQGIYSLIGKSNPNTILIFSPNHSDIGNCDIVTSTESWSTPFGTIEVDKDLQSQIFSSHTICYDDTVFPAEHGIAGLLPFIKYYLPNTKIIPFSLKKYIDQPNLQRFISSLITLDTPKISYISSIDFSHGLSLDKSQIKDAETTKLISEKDITQIQKLTQENVDSPASLIIAIKLVESLGGELKIIDHKNSSFYNNNIESVTTYFFLENSPLTISHSGLDTESIKIIPSPLPSLRGSVLRLPRQIRNEPVEAGGIPTRQSSSDDISLIFTGDVMLGRSVNTRIIKYNDYSWPFLKVSDFLKNADLTIINLESPLKSGCSPTDSGMIFCADPKSVAGLITSGVDIANIANNHILNQGKAGIDETIATLENSNISPVGLKKPLFKTVKNIKFAFVGFNDIGGSGPDISTATPEEIKSQISSAKNDAQFVVANFHWGNEYSLRSTHQRELAHLAIDSGADIVIGHHPHWVQEFEEYKDKPIFYSLGNLVFDQMWSEKTRQGLIVKITLKSNQIVGREEFPVLINDYGQPTITSQASGL